VEQGREAEAVCRELVAALRDLRDPETRQAMVDAVYRREDLYSGPYVADAPDLLVVMRDYAYMTRDGYEGVQGQLVGKPMQRSTFRLPHSGNHRLDGILIMAGPGVRPGAEISGATLLDVTPTVLYSFGIPTPSIMDGHVLRQAFDDDYVNRRPPRRVLSAPPPVEKPIQRELAVWRRIVGRLEDRVRHVEQVAQASGEYARQLEAAIATKNDHIARLESVLTERDTQIASLQVALADTQARLEQAEGTLAHDRSGLLSRLHRWWQQKRAG